MGIYTASELEFLRTAQLGRLATVGTDGAPHISPVTFRANDDGTIDFGGGGGFAKRKKWRDMLANPSVAFVVDDVLPPWRPRCVEIRGRAELFTSGGQKFGRGWDHEWVRIHPRRIVSFGIANGGGNRTIE